MDGMGDQGNGLMRENAAPATGGAAGLTAKALASRAAAAALLGPAVAAGQWVYRRCAGVASPDNAASPVTVAGLATPANTTAAGFTVGPAGGGAWGGRGTRAGA